MSRILPTFVSRPMAAFIQRAQRHPARRLLPRGVVFRRMVAVASLLVAVPAIGQDATSGGEGAMEPLPSVDTHVVEPGDTLWDLSEKVLGSPWLWPKVWSFNPEITNPHWIYPGDVVRFYPSEVELPSQAELVAGVREIPDMDEVDYAIDDEEVPDIEVIDTRPPGPVRRTDTWRRFVNFFVTPRELAEAGTLTNSVHDKLLLSPRDDVMLTIPGDKPSPGDRYLVYRTLGQVVHPRTQEPWGYMTQVTGIASIKEVEKRVTRARLDYALVEIERGQYVTLMDQDFMVELRPKPASGAVEAMVMTTQIESGDVAGQSQVVFIDKGSRDGLERGNELSVLVQGDPVTGDVEGMPTREIGRLLVIQANETASTCLVTKSLQEIEPGATAVTITG